ncbi:MAG: stage V sporulation protein G [Planctomycetes bacterium]|nr:stage V sporulation protein G [Planctomycetota bacterium]
MEITEVRIKLMEDSDDRLQAFCSITLDDCFVIRDLKIIEGSSGPFVAMPSRKLTSHCPHCGAKNHLRSGYCNQCGGRLKDDRSVRDADGRVKLYADIAHPINSECREMIQKHVIAEYQAELDRATQPGYMSRYDESYGDDYEPEEARTVPTAVDAGPTRVMPEHSHIQPANVEPRPPHRPMSPPVRDTARKNDGFGAGVFE